MRMNTQLVLIITTSQILKVPSIEQLAIFKSLKGFPELPNTVPTKSINPFKQVQNPQNRTIPCCHPKDGQNNEKYGREYSSRISYFLLVNKIIPK